MLRTEGDVLRTLERGTYSLQDLYAEVAANADIERDDGLRPPTEQHRTDAVWKRRVRSWLQHRKAAGQARRVDEATWLIDGTPESPRRMLLVGDSTLRDIELRVADAVDLLGSIDEPVDLIVTDPPYALNRGNHNDQTNRMYATRDQAGVVPGYVDVPAEDYEAFTRAWISAALPALRAGAQVAIVTGPQQAAVAQYVAEREGLRFVSSIAAYRAFAKRTTRRPAFAHWTITVLCKGPVASAKRTFNCPADLPKAKSSGADYPLDFWLDNGRADRKAGLLRYDNSLPQKLCRRIIEAFSNHGDLLVDPMLGGGGFVEAAMDTQRRMIAGDLNPAAVRYTAARLLDERLWPRVAPPGLPGPARHPRRGSGKDDDGQLSLLAAA